MIKHITLKNFKSHQYTALGFSNLNIFAGINGVGKSSIIQAMLLLRQTYQKNRLHLGLDLNRPLCDIGNAEDALYQYADTDLVEFSLQTGEANLHWQFKADKLYATFLPVIPNQINNDYIASLSLFGTHFQYLSAARWTPRQSYPKDSFAVEQERQISIEKGQGELVAHFLNHYGEKEVFFDNIKHPDAIYDNLLGHVTAWEREISTQVNIHLKDTGTGFEIFYSFDRENATGTNQFRAENVGFGITYSLPILVAILSAQPNSIIFIENPEAHLHPAAQAKLAELIALAAQNGIQIFLETHSDHIINGILVACKKWENNVGGINRDLVRIYHFDRDDKKHIAQATEVKILEGGRITYPPQGFFDQISKDKRILMGF